MAAVLACGKGAVLSHQCAAALWGISPTSPATTHVTVPGPNGRRKRRGIVVHRSTTLTPAEATRWRGIPVTTRTRTLGDLGYGPEPTRSGLERAFLRLCTDHGIRKPDVNVRLGDLVVDFLWRTERLIVETDGYAYHSNRSAFRSDRARDRELTRRGFTVLRVADEELTAAPAAVVASLRAHLRKASDRRPRMGPT